jgi:hypothetical protein
MGLRNGRRKIRERFCRIARNTPIRSHFGVPAKERTSLERSAGNPPRFAIFSPVQLSERKWQRNWSITKRIIGFSRARAFCLSHRSGDVHKFRFCTQIRRPEPWLRPASPAYSRSQRAIFSGVAVRARHSDERVAKRFRGVPDLVTIRSRCSASEFDKSKEITACHRIFCWT